MPNSESRRDRIDFNKDLHIHGAGEDFTDVATRAISRADERVMTTQNGRAEATNSRLQTLQPL